MTDESASPGEASLAAPLRLLAATAGVAILIVVTWLAGVWVRLAVGRSISVADRPGDGLLVLLQVVAGAFVVFKSIGLARWFLIAAVRGRAPSRSASGPAESES